MAEKPKSMSLIKQLLRLYQQGYKIKTMAKGLGISKNTVKSYIFKIQQNKWDVKHLVELENPVLEAKFHVRNPANKDKPLNCKTWIYKHNWANYGYMACINAGRPWKRPENYKNSV